MTVKFHEDAIILYGVSQVAEGTSAIQSSAVTTGTITVAGAATAVTGVGTLFLAEVAVGSYLYTDAGLLSCQVEEVTSDTAIVCSPALEAFSAEAFATGLGPKNALAALNLNYSTEITSEAFTYVGDELSRDEETVITDKYAKFDCEVFLPKLGTIAGADPVESEVPMTDWFQSSGMAIILSTGSAGYVKISNGQASNEYMSIEVRRSSPDIATDKAFVMSNCRGMIDLDGTVGTRCKLKFGYSGNLDEVVQKTKLVADFQSQKADFAPSIKSTTVTLSNLEVYIDENEPTVGLTNFCFDKVLAPNTDGYEYDRYLTSCEDGWSKGATPTDVTATIIEDSADAIYNPNDHLEDNHRLQIDYGNVVGEMVSLTWHKLQLANVTTSTVAKYAGQDLAFRNVSTFDITLS